jgi:hypothetical protein
MLKERIKKWFQTKVNSHRINCPAEIIRHGRKVFRLDEKGNRIQLSIDDFVKTEYGAYVLKKD